MRLTAKIMFVLLVTVVVFTALASYFSVRSAYRAFESKQQQLARQMGEQLHRRAERLLQQEGLAGVNRLIDRVALDQRPGADVRWVWFERNAPIAQSPWGGPEYLSAIQSGQIVSIVSHDERGRRQLRTYLQLRTDSGRPGGLEIIDSFADVERQARQTARSALLMIGGLALVCTGVTYLAGLRWVALPLVALVEKTRRVGEGDFSEPLHLAGNDELSQLADAVNQMCAKLSSQQERIVSESTQRVAAMEQLRHADRLKTVGRLAAGLAHELGTPLNVIAGRAALIASGKLPEVEVIASARTIKSEADRITGFVRQLLDFARPREPRHVRTDLSALTERTLELLQPLAAKKQISLIATTRDSPLSADVDEAQLQQVITNVVMNAIQVMDHPGSVTLDLSDVERVAPTATESRQWVRIRVDDEGPGIPPEVQRHIFEPFFTTKDTGEATGLGLSITFGIVQDHGGWIDVQSESGKGARFDIYVPQERST
jgi:two-component system NtrC family sensor kinase